MYARRFMTLCSSFVANNGLELNPLVWGYPPFLGRRVVLRIGIARGSQWEPCWEDSGVREVGSGDSQADGGFCAESPASAEELSGVEEIAGAEEIPGAVAIASVGINI